MVKRNCAALRYWSILTALFIISYVLCARNPLLLLLAPPPPIISRTENCDLFRGEWVYDESYPLYQRCSILEQGFRCQENGRPDTSYTKWRWKPRKCALPRFDVGYILDRLHNKRITFVGDSMGRTQWESLVCMLMTGIPSSTVYETGNRTITKLAKHLAFYFTTHNLTVEFYRSPFLVQQTRPPRHAPKRVRSVLRLDQLDSLETEWRDTDVLIFNSGHWWNPTKTFHSGCYFLMADSLKLGLKIDAAYKLALTTWALWVNTSIDTSRTRVFFRSFEPSHWDSKKSCSPPNVTSMATNHNHVQSTILGNVLDAMSNQTRVVVLNITSLSDLRSDGHIANWSKGPPPLDCSHWCLPGIPDTWNELLYAFLIGPQKFK